MDESSGRHCSHQWRQPRAGGNVCCFSVCETRKGNGQGFCCRSERPDRRMDRRASEFHGYAPTFRRVRPSGIGSQQWNLWVLRQSPCRPTVRPLSQGVLLRRHVPKRGLGPTQAALHEEETPKVRQYNAITNQVRKNHLYQCSRERSSSRTPTDITLEVNYTAVSVEQWGL